MEWFILGGLFIVMAVMPLIVRRVSKHEERSGCDKGWSLILCQPSLVFGVALFCAVVVIILGR